MKKLHWTFISLVFLGLILGTAGLIIRHVRKGSSEPAGADSAGGPVAKVKVVPIKQTKIEETLTAYGTVIASPGSPQTYSVPSECRVLKVHVTQGQAFKADTLLMEVDPGPEAKLQLKQARNERDAAEKQAKIIKSKLDMKLATNQELIEAEQRFQAARMLVENLEQRGLGSTHLIRSESAGIVSQIKGEPGQIVPAGEMLLETIGENQINVRLGIESEDMEHIQEGQPVSLLSVNGKEDSAVVGHISQISREVNPETRLVYVYVTPASGSKLFLNDYIRGTIAIASSVALVVPRASVLPEGSNHILYTVENGRAIKHVVEIGLENEQSFQVIGKDLHDGQSAVVVGNSELEDGTSVIVESGQ